MPIPTCALSASGHQYARSIDPLSWWRPQARAEARGQQHVAKAGTTNWQSEWGFVDAPSDGESIKSSNKEN